MDDCTRTYIIPLMTICECMGIANCQAQECPVISNSGLDHSYVSRRDLQLLRRQ